MNVDIVHPAWIQPVFDRRNRYCVFYGGRGSGKSWAIADVYITKCITETCVVLACREFLNSLDDSVLTLIRNRLEHLGLSDICKIIRNKIFFLNTGSVIIVRGLSRNTESLKGLEGLTDIWIEEAASISKRSWIDLEPTLRKEGSQAIISLNPRFESDCIYNEFILNQPPPDAYVVERHWTQNKYWTSALESSRTRALALNADTYSHVWDGQLLKHSDAQIFKNKWIIENFERDMSQNFYLGLDFGYSVDPTAAVACYIKDNVLYISHEAGKTKLDIDNIGAYCEKRIPMFKRKKVYADCANPGNIAYLVKHGYNVEAALKKTGSIEDGIAFIRSFDKVVIHSSCVETAKEFMLYSYEIDRHSEEITTKIIDKHNHYIDAIRYALNKIIYKKQTKWQAYEAYAMHA